MADVHDAELKALRESVRAFLRERSPEAEVRRLMETDDGYDVGTWRLMADQLGLQGLALPEAHGGGGAGFGELSVVLEEMGAALYPGPFLSTVVLAATALVACGDVAAAKEHLPGIAAGELVATLAADLSSVVAAPTGVAASGADGGWRLDGTVSPVLDGHVAELVLVPAEADGEDALFVVRGSDVERAPLPVVDGTRRLARLTLAATSATLVAQGRVATEAVERALLAGAAALAAEQAGACAEVLRTAVTYAHTRVQFGQPIGAFQAVKHKCADMFMLTTSAAAAAHRAARAVVEDDPELPVLASVAKAYCSDAYAQVAADNVQVHGGIGYTWEHTAHLHLRRAKAGQVLLGDPWRHRQLLAGRLGL